MKTFKSIEQAEYYVRSNQEVNIDVSKDGLDRMLEINERPGDKALFYFLNTREGRQSLTRHEAASLIKESK